MNNKITISLQDTKYFVEVIVGLTKENVAFNVTADANNWIISVTGF